MNYLILRPLNKDQKQVKILSPSTLTIGKADTCDYILSGDSISLFHALMEVFSKESITIKSLCKETPVEINGEPIEKAKLNLYDIITIGDIEFVLTDEDKNLKRKETEKIFSEEDIANALTLPQIETEKIPDFVIRAGWSLRLKWYWHDILLSDDLFPLSDTITIGTSKNNTYITPGNGLSKKHPLFVFNEFNAYLVFNKNLTGHINKNEEYIKLENAKDKFSISSYKNNGTKIKLDLSNKGVINYDKMKLEFCFVKTPAPAARERLFANMDRPYRNSLLACTVTALIFSFLFYFINPPQILAGTEKDFSGSQTKPILIPVKSGITKSIVEMIRRNKNHEGKGPRKYGKDSLRSKNFNVKTDRQKSESERIREKGIISVLFHSKALKQIMNSESDNEKNLRQYSDTLQPTLRGSNSLSDGWGLRDTKGKGSNGKIFMESDNYGLSDDPGPGTGERGKGPGDIGDIVSMINNKTEPVVKAPDLNEGTKFYGKIDPELVEKVLKNHFGYFKWCYDRELNTNPKLEGKLTAHFMIGKGGKVISSRSRDSSLKNHRMEACISSRIATLQFPSPEEGVVEVFYPLMFKLAGMYKF